MHTISNEIPFGEWRCFHQHWQDHGLANEAPLLPRHEQPLKRDFALHCPGGNAIHHDPSTTDVDNRHQGIARKKTDSRHPSDLAGTTARVADGPDQVPIVREVQKHSSCADHQLAVLAPSPGLTAALGDHGIRDRGQY